MKVITIGRSSECSVVINDVKVSRVHAQLVQSDNGNISVVDLGSTNGTMVNGKRIVGEMRLNPGDELRVGDTVLPWQKYIATMPSQTFQPMASNTQSPATVVGEDAVGMPASQPGDNKSKNTLLWIILAVVLGLLVTGGVLWLLLSQDSGSTSTQGNRFDTTILMDSTDNLDSSIISEDSIRLSNIDNYFNKLFDKQLQLRRQRQQTEEQKRDNNAEPSDSIDQLFVKKIKNANPTQIYFCYRILVNKSLLEPDAQYQCLKHDDNLKDAKKEDWSKQIIDCYNKALDDQKVKIRKAIEKYIP